VHISSRSPPSELAQQWQADVPHHSFTTYQIDLNNSQSIARSVQLIQESKVQFDFLVANAAVGYDEGDSIPSEELASSTLRTNVIATIDFVKQFLPLLAPQGRVLLISSFMGALSAQPTPIRQKLNDPSITEAEILSIAEDYIAAAAKKQMGGYHWSAYRTSKALLNAWGRFILPY
jgi:carbonyl reductase 1